MSIEIKFKGNGLKKLDKALKALSGRAAARAQAEALNEVGKVARNKVTASVAKQVGVSKAVAAKRGGIVSRPATAERQAYEIRSTGGYLSLKDTNAKQTASGTAASPWGTRRNFAGAFMGPKRWAVALKLNGHVFHRTGETHVMHRGAFKGQMREGIEKMHGAAIPKEIVRDESREVFETYTAQRLPKRVAHQLKRATNGAFD